MIDFLSLVISTIGITTCKKKSCKKYDWKKSKRGKEGKGWSREGSSMGSRVGSVGPQKPLPKAMIMQSEVRMRERRRRNLWWSLLV